VSHAAAALDAIAVGALAVAIGFACSYIAAAIWRCRERRRRDEVRGRAAALPEGKP
jgi:hypothetical protein